MKKWQMIWINETRRIASFHAVEGFIPHPLLDRSQYLNFIENLLEMNYCFQ